MGLRNSIKLVAKEANPFEFKCNLLRFKTCSMYVRIVIKVKTISRCHFFQLAVDLT